MCNFIDKYIATNWGEGRGQRVKLWGPIPSNNVLEFCWRYKCDTTVWGSLWIKQCLPKGCMAYSIPASHLLLNF